MECSSPGKQPSPALWAWGVLQGGLDDELNPSLCPCRGGDTALRGAEPSGNQPGWGTAPGVCELGPCRCGKDWGARGFRSLLGKQTLPGSLRWGRGAEVGSGVA